MVYVCSGARGYVFGYEGEVGELRCNGREIRGALQTGVALETEHLRLWTRDFRG